MVTRLILFLFVALGGVGLTIRMAWNARLRIGTGSPLLATIISICVSLTSLCLVWLSGTMQRGAIPPFNSLPKWAWFGGVFAAYYLLASVIAIPRLGAASVFSLVIAGQVLGAIILDTTGAFSVPELPLTPTRIVGTILLLTGVLLIQKR